MLFYSFVLLGRCQSTKLNEISAKPLLSNSNDDRKHKEITWFVCYETADKMIIVRPQTVLSSCSSFICDQFWNSHKFLTWTASMLIRVFTSIYICSLHFFYTKFCYNIYKTWFDFYFHRSDMRVANEFSHEKEPISRFSCVTTIH